MIPRISAARSQLYSLFIARSRTSLICIARSTAERGISIGASHGADDGRLEIHAVAGLATAGRPLGSAGNANRRARRCMLGGVAGAARRFAACAGLAVAAAGASPDRDPRQLQPGVFLYAAPEMADPNFAEAVVLLIEHGSQGSMGLVVNRPTRVPLQELLRSMDVGRELHFYWGGPVQPEAILALVRSSWPSESARRVLPDVHLTGDLADVRAALADKNPGERLRVFTGYAGWGKGQLATEVRAGAWVVDRADARSIFAPDTSELWHRVYRILERVEARARPGPSLRPAAGTRPRAREAFLN